MTEETNLRNWFNSQVPVLIKLTLFLGCDLINSHKLGGRSFVNMFSGSPWACREAPWSDGGKLPSPTSQDLSPAPWLTLAWCHLHQVPSCTIYSGEKRCGGNVPKIRDHKSFHKTLWVYARVSDVCLGLRAKEVTKIEHLSMDTPLSVQFFP